MQGKLCGILDVEYADDSTSGNQCTTGNVERTVGVHPEAPRGRGCEKTGWKRNGVLSERICLPGND